jgi:hypothetical protein
VNFPLLIAASIATVLAIAFAFFTLPSWRAKRPLFALFPTRVTAVLAGVVALKGWLELFTHS